MVAKVQNTIKIFRSGLKLFLDCQRCFWLDVHHKIKRPPGYPYTLSAAEVYSWLLQRNGYQTQPHAYFVFYVVQKDGGGFANVLPFREELKRVDVDPDWVGDTFERAIETARQETAPVNSDHCDHCHYVDRVVEVRGAIPWDSNI